MSRYFQNSQNSIISCFIIGKNVFICTPFKWNEIGLVENARKSLSEVEH